MASISAITFNTGSTIPGTTQVNTFAIGTTAQDYSTEPGGLRWWASPDSDLGYLIVHQNINADQPNPEGIPNVRLGFWRSEFKTEESFIQRVEYITLVDGTPQSFESGIDANTWLTNNGYWSTYESNIVDDGLILNWDIQNITSYPGTGTTITDLKSNSNGSLVGTIDYSSGSPKYLNVQGSSSEYLVTNTSLNSFLSPVNTGTEISYFVWVYPTGNGIIVNEQGTTTPAASWHDSQIEIVSGQLKFRLWELLSPYITSSTPITLNTWNYIGLTYSGTTLTAYLNGQNVGSVNGFSRLTPYNNGGGIGLYYSLGATDTVTNMGDGNGATFRFGSFQVYNRGLSSSEVLTNYNNTKTPYITIASPTPTPTPSITPSISITPTPTPTPSATSGFVNPSLTIGPAVTINTQSPFSGGGNSYVFSSSVDSYITTPGSDDWAVGTGDFTIEWFSYQTSLSQYQRIFTIGNYPFIKLGVSIENGTFYYWADNSFRYSSSSASATNEWIHWAVVRNTNATRIFKNGTQLGPFIADSFAIIDNTTPLVVGNTNTFATNAALVGYLTNFRWVKGLAVYTDNFTVPTSQLTAVAPANPYGGSNTQAIPAGFTKLLIVP